MGIHSPGRAVKLWGEYAKLLMSYSIQNNVIQIIGLSSSTNRNAFVLAADSGLIGSPQKKRQTKHQASNEKEAGKKKEYMYGYNVQCILQPAINAGDPVVVKSQYVDGTFRADSVNHKVIRLATSTRQAWNC